MIDHTAITINMRVSISTGEEHSDKDQGVPTNSKPAFITENDACDVGCDVHTHAPAHESQGQSCPTRRSEEHHRVG